jgi:hypothetical protein
MNTKRIIAAVMVAAMGMTTTACIETTQGFTAGGPGSAGSNGGSSIGGGQLEEIKTDELDAELDAMEKAMADVQAEVSKLSILGLANSASGAQSKSVDDKINEGVRKVFDALGKGIDKAKAKSAELRAKVNGQLAKLDPLNPLHIALVMKLGDLNKYLDRLDAEIAGAIQRVVDLVDAKVADLDSAVAKLDPKNPLSIIAMIYWAKVKQTIVECNTALAAKI